MANQIKIIMNWYELEGKSLVGEEEIEGLSIRDILKIFDAPFWNGLYQCWAIEPQHVAAVQPYVSHIMQPELHAYFIETIKINQPSSQ